ncbi:MAG: flagellar type III secretion system protein FlhB [Rhodobacteraceae bacterium]|nr:flagellar type III secretion system protein FlhB [Paracoccaceae bacterium]
MSGDDQNSSDKSHEPTEQKLKKAREKGEIARSTDMAVAAGYAGMVLTALAVGGYSVQRFGSGLMTLLDQPDRIAGLMFSGAVQAPFGQILLNATLALAPWFTFPAAAVLISIIAQKGLVFAPSKLQPKMSRISVLKNAGNKFGRSGLFEFAKSTTKLFLYSICLGFYLNAKLPEIVGVIETGAGPAVSMLARLCIEFMMIVLVIATALGAIDALWQHKEHLRKNRMSHKEVMDETKESEGDPYIKQQRRQRAQQIAMNQMMAEVPKGDVVIVNPTHYAICLKWDRVPGSAPVCVAKGVDEMAAAIREAATMAGVPIHHDPPTARALHATANLGQEIPEEHYRAVAASIRFAEQMRLRAKGRIT